MPGRTVANYSPVIDNRGRRTTRSCRAGHGHACGVWGWPGRIGRRAAQSKAWILLFSSAHSTSARSAGCRCRLTMSRTFSTNRHPSTARTVSVRCGSAKTPLNAGDGRLAQPHVLGQGPRALLSRIARRRLQHREDRAFDGEAARRGAPGLDSPSKPGTRASTNRRRHLPTVVSSRAGPRRWRVVFLAAHRNTMRVPYRQRLRHRPSPRVALQRLMLAWAHYDAGYWAASPHDVSSCLYNTYNSRPGLVSFS